MKKAVAAIVAAIFALGSVSALAADGMQKEPVKQVHKVVKKTHKAKAKTAKKSKAKTHVKKKASKKS